MNESSVSRFENITDDSGNTNGGFYYLKCNWQYNSFTIYLTDLTNVWSSNVTTKYIENILKPQGMSFDQYFQLLKKSLLKQDQTKREFDYKIDKYKRKNNNNNNNNINNNEDIEFIIIIILSEFDNINVKSSIPLIKLSNHFTTFQHYFDWLFDKYQSLSLQNQTLTLQTQSLQSQFNQSLEQNKLFQLEKDRIESNLIEKFIIILNEKKKKIKEYKQTINNLLLEQKSLSSSSSSSNCKCNCNNNNNKSIVNNNKNKSPSKQQQQVYYTTPKKNKRNYQSNLINIDNDDNDDDDDLENNINDENDNEEDYKPTFNNSTPPLLDLLSNDYDSYYNVPTNVRKKFKPTPTLTTTTTTTTTTSTASIMKTPTKKRNSTSPQKSPLHHRNINIKKNNNYNNPSSPMKKYNANGTLIPNNNNSLIPITPMKSKSKLFNFNDDDNHDIGASELLNDL
ncbi:hypothetical protein ACTFIR_007763 [Dictyostelium discoideum]